MPIISDETVHLHSVREKSRVDTREIAWDCGSTPRPANLSAVSLPRRNECQGIHCRPIEKEEKRQVPARFNKKCEKQKNEGKYSKNRARI